LLRPWPSRLSLRLLFRQRRRPQSPMQSLRAPKKSLWQRLPLQQSHRLHQQTRPDRAPKKSLWQRPPLRQSHKLPPQTRPDRPPKKSLRQRAAPTVAQVPASNAAVQTAEKEPAPAAPTAVGQAPTTNASENEAATKPDEAGSGPKAKATAEQSSLKPGSGLKDVVAALNASVINFGSNSAELPASAASFLQSAADDLKQMPAGHKLEIAGYTDNTGNERMNLALSQRRADAVRGALVKSGANADMLVAKGYGSADPIASNDTPEGRLRNRRIEYRLLKTPDRN
jgi:outer membrane protein OmpA-like peptidoglycan-associated protein